MLGPEDVGHRVVVRRVVGRRDDRPLMSDALGELREFSSEELTVETDAGPVTVPHAAVVAAKRVPPRRASRRAMAALEYAANEAWPAPEQVDLGQWLLRAAGGWTMRANSALPVGDPGLPLDAAIDRVAGWYAARGLSPRFHVPLPLAAPVDAALAARGWRPGQPVLVQTARLATVRARVRDGSADAAGTGAPAAELVLTGEPTPQWLDLAATHTRHRAAGPLPPVAYQVLTAGGQVPVRFVHGYDPAGRLVAAGRGTVTGAGRWLGLSRVAVAPPARRRGLARQVVTALADWAYAIGATDAFLQVEEDNTAAIGLYAGLGFTTHHRYLPRTP